ncbi:probable LRR receptor-like serine/threonine-protein kinase At1g05700 isoform X2 [Tripterygium wilfordii]|uniref:probable LRR receptor-like serine/threonine-protein kinase At1g05700 isoform X2 n=1 Tax=Tripterygium wilfordii TaxID=458696 RepID=UPI0018F85948|nr:probable LRR receptor-like serine/threonine-protein kinase At1g05700 isoform X2 [Tripterygium wilfordii]
MVCAQMLVLVLVVELVSVPVITSLGTKLDAATNSAYGGRRTLSSDNPDFISIDCGSGEDYVDNVSGISYKSDLEFTNSGENREIQGGYISQDPPYRPQLNNVRSFPQGTKNCYTLNPIQGKNNSYLIRAVFLYGNYDGSNVNPKFDLHLDGNFWETVRIDDTSTFVFNEIIHVASRDVIHVCLVNTGLGTPFISALELRLLENSIYNIESAGALALVGRFDIGTQGSTYVRHEDDPYDRLWRLDDFSTGIPITTTSNITAFSSTVYKLSAQVLRTAVIPSKNHTQLIYYWNLNTKREYYVCLHFMEFEEVAKAQPRQITITLNSINDVYPITLYYLKPQSLCPQTTLKGNANFTISKTTDSDRPPILNAYEVYHALLLQHSPTNQDDFDAIVAVKQTYKITRDDWQGDPCVPPNFLWSGLNCSYDVTPRIISLNLSSNKLNGNITFSFANLTALQFLDLSYNNFTGSTPEILASLPNLQILNLAGNNLNGPVPRGLVEKSEHGSLQLSLPESLQLGQTDSDKGNSNFIIPIVISIVALLLLISIITFWRIKRQRGQVTRSKQEDALKSKNRQFTYSDVVRITANFSTVIGEGGYGKVYLGTMRDGSQVAVKVLSSSSNQGYKEFQAEVQHLMLVYHRNLVSLVGYSDDRRNRALVYEYLSNGNLQQHLSVSNIDVLSWNMRLQIAIDAANGLEYLHNGCKPPIIHRDLKTSNILLNESMQAKIADFGLSRSFATENDSHVTTRPAGTPGYLDPEYQSTGNFNKKSDVYSFGIILLELITGQPVISRSHESSKHVLQWVNPLIERGDIQGIVDGRLQGEFNTNVAWKALEIAMSCVPPAAIQRPNMSHVLADLKECLAVEMASGTKWKTDNSMKRSNNSFEMTSLALDTEMVPSAR